MKQPAKSCGKNGFTLVELLVALAILGILSTMVITLLAGASQSFAGTSLALQKASSLMRLKGLLAADLGQALHRPSLTADGKLQGAFTLTANGFVLVRGGVAGQLPHVQKIAWGFDGHRLQRQSFTEVDEGAPGEAVALLPNVRRFHVAVADRHGWQESWQPKNAEELPRAVAITLAVGDAPPLTMKFLVAP